MICKSLKSTLLPQFISGLHKEIADVVELQPYVYLEDVIKLAIKIERQQKKGSTRVIKPYGASSIVNYPSKVAPKPEFKKENPKSAVVDKGKFKFESSQPTGSRDIKCFKCLGHRHIAFQCPNRKVMIVRDIVEEVVSEDESNMVVEEEVEQVASPEEGELLVIHQNLNM